MGYASYSEDILEARGEPKSSKIRKPKVSNRREPPKKAVCSSVEKQKVKVCVLQLGVERILKRLAKQERLSHLTIPSWAEHVRSYYKEHGGLPEKVNLVSLVAKSLFSLNHKAYARAIEGRWTIFEKAYKLT